jgi:ribosomal protein S18 acetylase RimI-like enzyme
LPNILRQPFSFTRARQELTGVAGEIVTIGRATVPLHYVRDLMEKNYEAVGFLPLPRLEEYAQRDQVLVQYENNEPCGYLAFGNGWPVLKVYQCCIQVDARRAAQATALVNRLIGIARERNCIAISLWCADDLESNGFWRALGFHFGGQREGGQKRGRKHNKWTLLISGTAQLFLFEEAA